ncbi:hypothetical protein TSUD_308230 [Trifolium subterraneum]|nr:hypothetical protein TSUD_308230 [Trifolium subterraneum]
MSWETGSMDRKNVGLNLGSLAMNRCFKSCCNNDNESMIVIYGPPSDNIIHAQSWWGKSGGTNTSGEDHEKE